MVINAVSLLSPVHSEDHINRSLQPLFSSLETEHGIRINETSISELQDEPVLFALVKSGGSEQIFRKIFTGTAKPVFLISVFMNNSLPASLEILTYMRQNKIRGRIITGSAAEIAESLKAVQSASDTARKLRTSRAGVIGKPSDWLIASSADPKNCRAKTGISLVSIPIKSLIRETENASANTDMSDRLIAGSSGLESVSRETVIQADRIYAGMKKIINSHCLDSVTVRCFDLLTALDNTGCLALSRLNDEGITAGCEGDVPALVSMMLGQELSGNAVFMANPSIIDSEKNEVMFGHCTVPVSMLNSYRIATHFESGIGAAIRGEMAKKTVTVIRLDSSFGKIAVLNGVINEIPCSSEHCRTQINVAFEQPVSYFTENPLGNHHIIIYGDIREKLKTLCEILEIEMI